MESEQDKGGWALASGVVLLAVVGALSLSACGSAESKDPAPVAAAPSVTVATAQSSEINDWDEFSGRFEAVEHVELRPRVSGYIEQVSFVEGREVKKGETLFVIDARPYHVELQRAQAELARVKAQAMQADNETVRARKLLESRAISQEEADRRISQSSQSLAELASAQAAVSAAQLNMSFTRVIAPIDGRVSRAAVTTGNYVTAGQTMLTSVVSLDPIYVSFDGDEQRYLRYAQRANAAESGSAASTDVYVGLANDQGYPHAGKLNFVDNALDPATGTIRTRAVLSNAERKFTPGLFARVRLPGSGRYQATLVPDSAVATDQDRRYVLVVNKDDVVEHRQVELGGSQDQMRVVQSGLQPGERIVVSGLQRAKPGAKVSPQEAEAATANAEGKPVPKS